MHQRERAWDMPGAIVAADGTGSAQNKEKALRDAGVIIAESTVEIVGIIKDILK